MCLVPICSGFEASVCEHVETQMGTQSQVKLNGSSPDARTGSDRDVHDVHGYRCQLERVTQNPDTLQRFVN